MSQYLKPVSNCSTPKSNTFTLSLIIYCSLGIYFSNTFTLFYLDSFTLLFLWRKFSCCLVCDPSPNRPSKLGFLRSEKEVIEPSLSKLPRLPGISQIHRFSETAKWPPTQMAIFYSGSDHRWCNRATQYLPPSPFSDRVVVRSYLITTGLNIIAPPKCTVFFVPLK